MFPRPYMRRATPKPRPKEAGNGTKQGGAQKGGGARGKVRQEGLGGRRPRGRRPALPPRRTCPRLGASEARARLHVHRTRTAARSAGAFTRPDPGARDPAGLDRRLDLPARRRPPPGHRPRRPGPQAVPLPPAWREARDETKYGRLIDFGAALPAIRARVTHDLARPGLPREKVLATVVQLLETTLIRVGNEEYAKAERLLRPDHPARPPRRRRRRHHPLPVPRQERQ